MKKRTGLPASWLLAGGLHAAAYAAPAPAPSMEGLSLDLATVDAQVEAVKLERARREVCAELRAASRALRVAAERMARLGETMRGGK